jgi:hypothetical protein
VRDRGACRGGARLRRAWKDLNRLLLDAPVRVDHELRAKLG